MKTAHPYLKDKIINVKPAIDKNSTWAKMLAPEWSMGMKSLAVTFPDTNKNFQVKKEKQHEFVNSVTKNPCPDLNDEMLTEKEYFERVLGLNLNPFDPNNSMQKVYSNGSLAATDVWVINELKLDLSNASDMIKYKVLLTNMEEVAATKDIYKNHWRPRFMFYMEEDSNGVDKEVVNIVKAKVKAAQYFGDMVNNKEKLLQVLATLNKVYNPKTETTLLESAAAQIFENDTFAFVSACENPYKELIWLVELGRMTQVITYDGSSKLYNIPGVDKQLKKDDILNFYKQEKNQDKLAELELLLEEKTQIFK